MRGAFRISFTILMLITCLSFLSSQRHKTWFQVECLNLTDGFLQFTEGGHVLGFRKGDMLIASVDHALKVEFLNARPISPTILGVPQDAEKNRGTVGPLSKITYSDLWNGVTLVYEKHCTGVIQSTYIVQPTGAGAANAVDRIRLRYNVPVNLDENGGLIFSFATGRMKESPPMAWQEILGKKIPVDVCFRFLGEREVGFEVESYDPKFPLVIDPVISWHTFMGSGSADWGYAMAVDMSGNVYVAGRSDATWGTPVNPFTPGSGFDAFVAKLNSSGVLQWNTFMGSPSYDSARSIAVDKNGNVYVGGPSISTWGSPINPHSGTYDAFIAKLNTDGVRMWNTFLGLVESDNLECIAVDESMNVYVSGHCFFSWGSPIYPFYDATDVYVTKLDPGGALVWNTFMGGEYEDIPLGMAVDLSGNIYVTGDSARNWGSPIVGHHGEADVFVAKLNTDGVRQWNTFLGSSGWDFSYGIALDLYGNIYVTGRTDHPWWGSNPVNPYAGGTDVFVVKMNSGGVKQWNTFMGSSVGDDARHIAVDSYMNVYVSGSSDATWGNPIDPFSGGSDFIAKLDCQGHRFWHTFGKYGENIAVDLIGNLYAEGTSNVSWGTPVNPHAGDNDVFVQKIVHPFIHVLHGSDYDGNLTSDIAVFRPSTGYWYIKDIVSTGFGVPGDIPVSGDYDGDLDCDLAVYRPSTGMWAVKNQGRVWFGGQDDIPVPGDYNGDGITDRGLYQPGTGIWNIKDLLTVTLGGVEEIPIPGDYNGDGITDIAVYNQATGHWRIRNQFHSYFGSSGDFAVPGDYDGDGKTDIAIFRPSTGMWAIQGQSRVYWGIAGDVPVPGDYNGDGTTDIAIFRPSTGLWAVRGQTRVYYGLGGDIPLVR